MSTPARPRHTLVAFAAASCLALLEIFRAGMMRILEGQHASVLDLVHWVIPLWLGVVLVSPWCAFMAQRFPVRSGRVVPALLAHFVGAGVFAALHLTVLNLFHHLMSLAMPLFGHGHGLHQYVFYLGMEMSVYAAIVMVVLLLEARREAAERALAAARLERGLAAARLEALQAQIRPHFLFNTLNTLAVLARRGDSALVDHAIGDLGELLRASFGEAGAHEIALGEELQLLERYLALQQLRFPGKLEVEWQIDDAARSAWVPALLLQPLVENAVEHGLSTAAGGRVRVSARRNGDRLELEVADDGPGFPASPAPARGGLGLGNTRERLALLHGEAAVLETGTAPGGGGSVRIRLPWRTGGEHA